MCMWQHYYKFATNVAYILSRVAREKKATSQRKATCSHKWALQKQRWSEEIQIELFGHTIKQYVRRKSNTDQTIPTVKHETGNIFMCFYVAGIEGKLMVQNNIKLRKMCILCQKDVDRKKIYHLTWQQNCPHSGWRGLNHIGNLWNNLKTAVHKRLPSNLTQPEQFCKKEPAYVIIWLF